MSTIADPQPSSFGGWLARAEAWMDERGKGAWIAAMVLGFIFVWPVGLALLAYMIWSKRMFSNACGSKGRHFRHRHGPMGAEGFTPGRMARGGAFRSSGNTAFDAYKAETLQRLMDEQEQFEAFLDRLRAAKDKREFDAFMDERASAVTEASTEDDDAAEPAGEEKIA